MTDEETSIPLAEERVEIGRQVVETGRVRVSIEPIEHAEVLQIGLRDAHVVVEHVPVGLFVDAPPPVRTEVGVTIIPVLEERVVVTVRLFLREELHVRTETVTRTHEQTVVLRREQAAVEHVETHQAQNEGTDHHD